MEESVALAQRLKAKNNEAGATGRLFDWFLLFEGADPLAALRGDRSAREDATLLAGFGLQAEQGDATPLATYPAAAGGGQAGAGGGGVGAASAPGAPQEASWHALLGARGVFQPGEERGALGQLCAPNVPRWAREAAAVGTTHTVVSRHTLVLAEQPSSEALALRAPPSAKLAVVVVGEGQDAAAHVDGIGEGSWLLGTQECDTLLRSRAHGQVGLQKRLNFSAAALMSSVALGKTSSFLRMELALGSQGELCTSLLDLVLHPEDVAVGTLAAALEVVRLWWLVPANAQCAYAEWFEAVGAKAGVKLALAASDTSSTAKLVVVASLGPRGDIVKRGNWRAAPLLAAQQDVLAQALRHAALMRACGLPPAWAALSPAVLPVSTQKASSKAGHWGCERNWGDKNALATSKPKVMHQQASDALEHLQATCQKAFAWALTDTGPSDTLRGTLEAALVSVSAELTSESPPAPPVLPCSAISAAAAGELVSPPAHVGAMPVGGFASPPPGAPSGLLRRARGTPGGAAAATRSAAPAALGASMAQMRSMLGNLHASLLASPSGTLPGAPSPPQCE